MYCLSFMPLTQNLLLRVDLCKVPETASTLNLNVSQRCIHQRSVDLRQTFNSPSFSDDRGAS